MADAEQEVTKSNGAVSAAELLRLRELDEGWKMLSGEIPLHGEEDTTGVDGLGDKIETADVGELDEEPDEDLAALAEIGAGIPNGNMSKAARRIIMAGILRERRAVATAVNTDNGRENPSGGIGHLPLKERPVRYWKAGEVAQHTPEPPRPGLRQQLREGV